MYPALPYRRPSIERSIGILPVLDQQANGSTMRVIGRIRSAFADGASGDYRCQDCGTEFELDRQVCPVCGGYRIESVEWSGE